MLPAHASLPPPALPPSSLQLNKPFGQCGWSEHNIKMVALLLSDLPTSTGLPYPRPPMLLCSFTMPGFAGENPPGEASPGREMVPGACERVCLSVVSALSWAAAGGWESPQVFSFGWGVWEHSSVPGRSLSVVCARSFSWCFNSFG